MSKKSAKCISIDKQGLQSVKNSCIFNLKNFLLTLTLLKIVKQSISSFISLILLIINAKIVAKHSLGPINFIRAQVFYIYKLT